MWSQNSRRGRPKVDPNENIEQTRLGDNATWFRKANASRRTWIQKDFQRDDKPEYFYKKGAGFNIGTQKGKKESSLIRVIKTKRVLQLPSQNN